MFQYWISHISVFVTLFDRYEEKTEVAGTVHTSILTVINVSAALDYAIFTCTAHNSMGADSLDIQLLSTSTYKQEVSISVPRWRPARLPSLDPYWKADVISIHVWINKNVINENKQTQASGCHISYLQLISAHKKDEQNHERDFCSAMRFRFSRPEQQLRY